MGLRFGVHVLAPSGRDEWVALARQAEALSIGDILDTPYLWIGTTESICQGVLAARERWGFSYFTVFNDALEATAPIVTRLTGT